MTALLEVEALEAGYGQVQVLRGLDFTVDEGEVVVILGANGAGKTTTIRAVCGMISATGGRVAPRRRRTSPAGPPTAWSARGWPTCPRVGAPSST